MVERTLECVFQFLSTRTRNKTINIQEIQLTNGRVRVGTSGRLHITRTLPHSRFLSIRVNLIDENEKKNDEKIVWAIRMHTYSVPWWRPLPYIHGSLVYESPRTQCHHSPHRICSNERNSLSTQNTIIKIRFIYGCGNQLKVIKTRAGLYGSVQLYIYS